LESLSKTQSDWPSVIELEGARLQVELLGADLEIFLPVETEGAGVVHRVPATIIHTSDACKPVLRIRMFLGLLDPDPLVTGKDPDPSIIEQK
jgi:hypothetical protein